jgi:hypothetical protein
MYITNTAGCGSGGTYETYATSKASWVLATANATNTVYVKFKDSAGNETSCVSDSILHDNTGPDAPTGLSLGTVPTSDTTTPTLSWSASTDNAGGSGVASYQGEAYKTSDNSVVAGCSWTSLSSGSALTCTGGTLVAGTQYYMKVRAVDSAGNLGTASVNSANWIPVAFISCPTGYIAVPALAGYTTADFCVAKYEMKNVGNVATSEAAGLPWSTIARGTDSTTDGGAWKACKDLGTGYDLISNAQWQTIARNIADQGVNWSNGSATSGTAAELNRGHSDVAPNSTLAASTDDNDGCYGTGQTCSSIVWDSQRRTHVLSNGNFIWDFAGNLWEWVKDNNTASQGATDFISTFNTADSRQINYGNDTLCATPLVSPNCGMGYGYMDYSTGAIARGGAYYYWSGLVYSSGIFATDLSVSKVTAYVTSGFRCVYVP